MAHRTSTNPARTTGTPGKRLDATRRTPGAVPDTGSHAPSRLDTSSESAMTGTGSLPNDRGVLESVNVSAARTLEWRGHQVTTGIWKAPVDGRVAVRGVNVVGDDQADRSVHGGVDKAVYAYSAEDYDWWARQLGYEVGPGTFGDNLTVRDVAVTDAVIGERWRVGSVLLEVAQPRIPCYKLGVRMDDPHFPRRFGNAGRPGTYFRILEPGELAAGDAIEIVHRPVHDLTVGDVSHIYLHDRRQVHRLLDVPELAVSWRDWALDYAGRRTSLTTVN